MPPPTKDPDSKDVHVVTWPLFNSSKKVPAFNEVKQAPGIANCPVASMLAALAFTSVGQTSIQGMVSETADNVLTDLSSVPSGTLSNPPPGTTISSSRYFTVKLPSGSIDVSDVLYTDDHDSGWSPISSIGASKPDGTDVKFVTPFHGFAVLGFQGAKIRLYDPAKATTLLISPADFRHDFLAYPLPQIEIYRDNWDVRARKLCPLLQLLSSDMRRNRASPGRAPA
jgi:hypothetical protein